MPLDPEISLNIKAPTQASGINPLEAINTLSVIQNRTNQNRLFQQTFQAKQKAGLLLSASDPNNPEAGIRALMQDPETAPFAGEIIGQIRGAQKTLLDMQGERQTQAQSSLAATMKGLGAALQDPSMLEPLINAQLATTSTAVQPEVRKAIGAIVTGLGNGLPPGQAGTDLYQRRLSGMMLASGWTPEAIQGMTGSMKPKTEMLPLGPGGSNVMVQSGGDLLGGPGKVPISIAGQQQGQSDRGAGASGLIGPSISQQKYLNDLGGAGAKYQASLNERVSDGANLMTNITEAREALGNIKPGGGASTYARVAQLAQAFGLDPAKVDKIANGDLPSSQEFAKLMVNSTLSQIKQQMSGIGGESRLSEKEFETFLKNNPNLDTDPRAMDKIFNFWTRQYNRDYNEQQRLDAESQKPGFDIARWPAQWQKIMKEEKMVTTSTEAKGSQRDEQEPDFIVKDGRLVVNPKKGAPVAAKPPSAATNPLSGPPTMLPSEDLR